MIAGRIIPAIATTTAAITGLVCLQMYTLLQTDDITYLRGGNINLAISMFLLTRALQTQSSSVKRQQPGDLIWPPGCERRRKHRCVEPRAYGVRRFPSTSVLKGSENERRSS